MKHLKFLTLIAICFSFFSLTSCKKDKIDIRDQYVGTWKYTQLGSLTLYQNGQSIGTSPINKNGSLSITKSGDNNLIIDGQTFTVNGTHLSSDPQSIAETDNGVNIVGTETDDGTLGSNIITINSSMTGTWNSNNGASGNLSGSLTNTLIKQ